jgi:hypothetical protein
VGLERGPLSLVSIIEELLGKIVVALVYKLKNKVIDTPLSAKVGINFADKRRSA